MKTTSKNRPKIEIAPKQDEKKMVKFTCKKKWFETFWRKPEVLAQLNIYSQGITQQKAWITFEEKHIWMA